MWLAHKVAYNIMVFGVRGCTVFLTASSFQNLYTLLQCQQQCTDQHGLSAIQQHRQGKSNTVHHNSIQSRQVKHSFSTTIAAPE